MTSPTLDEKKQVKYISIFNLCIVICCISFAISLNTLSPSKILKGHEYERPANGMYSGTCRLYLFDAMVTLIGVLFGLHSISRMDGRFAYFYFLCSIYGILMSVLTISSLIYLLSVKEASSSTLSITMILLFTIAICTFRIFYFKVIKNWKTITLASSMNNKQFNNKVFMEGDMLTPKENVKTLTMVIPSLPNSQQPNVFIV